MLEKNEMIFGVRAVIEAIQAGREIDKVLVKKDIQSELSKELFTCLKNTLIPVQRVPVERINRITRKNHQGVVAFISSVTYQKTEDLVPFLFEEGKTPLFVMLDGITDVRNFGATEKGDYDYTKANYKDPVCIIMGAEDTGVPYEHLSLCDEWIKIPLMGKIESLNVSVAAGILIYEAVKQRGFTEDKTASAL